MSTIETSKASGYNESWSLSLVVAIKLKKFGLDTHIWLHNEGKYFLTTTNFVVDVLHSQHGFEIIPFDSAGKFWKVARRLEQSDEYDLMEKFIQQIEVRTSSVGEIEYKRESDI